MRTITALVLAGVLALAACSTAATPPASVASTPAPSVALTPAPTVTPIPPPTVAPPSPTAGELLSGVRSDLRAICEPLKTTLPLSAIAGVECKPKSDVVDNVTLYLFGSQQDLLTTYSALLAAQKVPSRTHEGRCISGRASEGAYVPEDTQPAPERSGCYVDATGMAHYVATLPPSVLVVLDGKVKDIAAVQRWAWLGNQDQPGNPTVWRSNAP